jgi:anaerobic magnesium-protoporphyrin IX monomethyl ester cyclase
MRVALVDLPAIHGVVSKDTVVGGYGSRLEPFSRVTRIIAMMKRRMHDTPSVHLAYLAAILAKEGHDVVWSRGKMPDVDAAIVLSSLVDYRHETAWADEARARGIRVGFIGLTASKLPELFRDHADFIVIGEPEAAVMRFARGHRLEGDCQSEAIEDLDTLPFPRWDLAGPSWVGRWTVPFAGRPYGGGVPLLASRGCPEFCTYCPHRILAGHRMRSVASIVDELTYVCGRFEQPYVIFRDPLFTQDRERVIALARAIRANGLDLRFECETRLDRLDATLLEELYAAGLRAISFGVESVSPDVLRKAGRRPIPEAQQRAMITDCRRIGIATAAFYVFGFLQDDWQSIAATIDYAIDLGSSAAQFKLLTPYPGTPLWKQMASRVYEHDWQRFDGFTPTFEHPRLAPADLRFLLGAAYTRFYMRPSWLADWSRINATVVRSAARRMDAHVAKRHARQEVATMARAVTC